MRVVQVSSLVAASDADVEGGAMVAVMLPKDQAEAVAHPEGNAAEHAHVTVAYLGKAKDLTEDQIDKASRIVRAVAEATPPPSGEYTALDHFGDPAVETHAVLRLNSDDMHRIHHAVTGAFDEAGIPYSTKFPEYKPHTSLGAWEHGENMPADVAKPHDLKEHIPFSGTHLTLAVAGKQTHAAFNEEARDDHGRWVAASGNPRPPGSETDSADGGSMYGEPYSEVSLRSSGFPQSSNRADLSEGELGSLSSGAASTSDHVLRVLSHGSQLQVTQSHTASIVAEMSDDESSRDWANEETICNSVNDFDLLPSGVANHSVAVSIQSPGPDMTSSLNFDLFEESINEGTERRHNKQEYGIPASTRAKESANGGFTHGPSILWPSMYEGLLRHGFTKSDAAAISNGAFNRYRKFGRPGDPGEKSAAAHKRAIHERRVSAHLAAAIEEAFSLPPLESVYSLQPLQFKTHDVSTEARDDLGRWVRENITVRRGGGQSISLQDNSEPTEGFAVSRPGMMQIDEDAAFEPEGHLTEHAHRRIEGFVRSREHELHAPGAVLGVFHDTDTHTVDVDVTDIHPKDDEEGAVALGRARGQKAIYKLHEDELVRLSIDVLTLAQFSVEDEARDYHGRWTNGNGGRVGSRKLSALDPDLDTRISGLSAENLQNQADRLRDHVPGFEGVHTAEEAIERIKQNVLDIHDMVPPERALVTRQWYGVAHQFGNDVAGEYGVSPTAVRAVVAVLSPQKDWNMNVALAKSVMGTLKADAPLTDKQSKYANDELVGAWERKNIARAKEAEVAEHKLQAKYDSLSKTIEGTPEHKKLVKQIEGAEKQRRKFPEKLDGWDGSDEAHPRPPERFHAGDLPSSMSAQDAAFAVRAVQPNPPNLPMLVHPDGSYEFEHVEGPKSAWGGYDTIAKAVSVYRDSSYENVNVELGTNHKVRSFFNNMEEPEDADHDDVTIDTHAYGIGAGMPWTTNSPQISTAKGHNITSSPSSTADGTSGTYPLFAEGYRSAAAERGVKPREMQSITWERWRELWPLVSRRGNAQTDIPEIRSKEGRGELSHEEANSEIERVRLAILEGQESRRKKAS